MDLNTNTKKVMQGGRIDHWNNEGKYLCREEEKIIGTLRGNIYTGSKNLSLEAKTAHLKVSATSMRKKRRSKLNPGAVAFPKTCRNSGIDEPLFLPFL